MDDITRTGIQFVPNDVKEEFGNSAFLMNAALNFINGVEKIVNQYEHQGKIQSLFSSKSLSQVANIMHESLSNLQNLITKQYLFEEQVNAFLGRKIHFAWADNEGKILFADEVTAQKFYATATKSKNSYVGTVSFSKELQKDATKLPSFLKGQLQQQIDLRLQSHQDLYREILLRWDDNQKENNRWSEKNPYYPEHKNQVYWRTPPKGIENSDNLRWSWSSNFNKGHISQGYIDFIFSQKINLTLNEHDIGLFMMTYVNKNKTPGIVKGDVVVQNTNDKIQIAVKSSNFDTASIGPYISVAYQIISFFNNLSDLTIDNVQLILNDLKKYNQAVIATGWKEAKDQIDKIAQSTGALVS